MEPGPGSEKHRQHGTLELEQWMAQNMVSDKRVGTSAKEGGIQLSTEELSNERKSE